jgi:hypothetical protein
MLPPRESMMPVLAGDDPALRCEPLRISLLELMRGAPEATPPDVFFQRWASLPAGTSCRSCCFASKRTPSEDFHHGNSLMVQASGSPLVWNLQACNWWARRRCPELQGALQRCLPSSAAACAGWPSQRYPRRAASMQLTRVRRRHLD